MSTPEFFAMRRIPGDCPSRAASSRQNVRTFQCFSVNGQTPTSRAISSPTCGVHCALSIRNPSSLVWTASPAYSCVGIDFSFLTFTFGARGRLLGSGGGRNGALAGHGHPAGDRDISSRQEQIPVGPLEEELAPVVAASLLQQGERADQGQRKDAGQRFGLVIEVDQERLAFAALDETVRVSVELGLGTAAGDHGEQVLLED